MGISAIYQRRPFLENVNASSTESFQEMCNEVRMTSPIPYQTKTNNWAHGRVVCSRCDVSESE